VQSIQLIWDMGYNQYGICVSISIFQYVFIYTKFVTVFCIVFYTILCICFWTAKIVITALNFSKIDGILGEGIFCDVKSTVVEFEQGVCIITRDRRDGDTLQIYI